MGVGIVERLENGKKEYVEYANKGGGSASEYVYIERFIKTETLLYNWNMGNGKFNTISAEMYDVVTGKYLGKNGSSDNNYIVRYVPLSFGIIPYYKMDIDYYVPAAQLVIGDSFFAHTGISIDLTRGIFNFMNLQALSENPFLTWYKAAYVGVNVDENQLKATFKTMIFRGFLKKLEKDDPMYLGSNSKNMDDAKSTFY